MDSTPFLPIITEATRFLFDQVGKWIDHARNRGGATSVEVVAPARESAIATMTREDFEVIEADPDRLKAAIDGEIARTNAYEIKGLVEQIQTHRKNLLDHEQTEAEYGALTPQHVKRAIEREAAAIVEKSARLQDLLNRIFGRSIEYD